MFAFHFSFQLTIMLSSFMIILLWYNETFTEGVKYLGKQGSQVDLFKRITRCSSEFFVNIWQREICKIGCFSHLYKIKKKHGYMIANLRFLVKANDSLLSVIRNVILMIYFIEMKFKLEFINIAILGTATSSELPFLFSFRRPKWGYKLH